MTRTPADPPLNEPSPLADAVERVAASVVGFATRRSAASGVIWRHGVVVTAASALPPRTARLPLVMPDGEQVAGEVRGVDGSTDLAAITFDSGLPAAAHVAGRAADAAPRVGDFVFAVGREPSGRVQASFGHVGAAGGEWRTWRGGRVERLIRLDGGLYPGLAGAPVADASGLVLGVASPALSRLHGVVLPVATVDRVLNLLLAHGHVPRGYLGIAAQPVRVALEGGSADGLLISSVAEGGPAAAAGLLVGDVVVAAGGRPVASIEALRELLGEQVGARLPVKIARGGQAMDLALDVAERPRHGCH